MLSANVMLATQLVLLLADSVQTGSSQKVFLGDIIERTGDSVINIESYSQGDHTGLVPVHSCTLILVTSGPCILIFYDLSAFSTLST